VEEEGEEWVEKEEGRDNMLTSSIFANLEILKKKHPELVEEFEL